MKLPHVYTAPDGDKLAIDADYIVTTNGGAVDTPKGPDAVALARAVLDAAGDTGHRVISTEELQRLVVHRAEQKGARSMRERAAQEVLIDTHRVPMAISEAIAALPLLPDEPARTPLTADTDA